MILIADSGSTKTLWRLIDDKKNIHQINSMGINPYFREKDELNIELKDIFKNQISPLGKLKEVHFYGAGVSTAENVKFVEQAISQSFEIDNIFVEHDLLGAARALCGREFGITCILGTGSNSCVYDGEKIISNVPSLGFILGDEGSGAYIGKKFLNALLYEEIEKDLIDRFYKRFDLSKEIIIKKVYKEALPNRFLASFSKFIYQNLKQQYFQDLICECFDDFCKKQIMKYPEIKNTKVHFTGSVAFYYSNFLRKILEKNDIFVGNITENPIAGLTLYHLDN